MLILVFFGEILFAANSDASFCIIEYLEEALACARKFSLRLRFVMAVRYDTV